MSRERLGNVLPQTNHEPVNGGQSSPGGATIRIVPRPVVVVPIEADNAASGNDEAVNGTVDEDSEAVEFVRFCYRRRAVAWPELYDEMCAVAARGDFRGMTYEELEGQGIGLALAGLPRLAAMAARVIAEERGPQPAAAAG